MNTVLLIAAGWLTLISLFVAGTWILTRIQCRGGKHTIAYEFGRWACVRCNHTPTGECRCVPCRRSAARAGA